MMMSILWPADDEADSLIIEIIILIDTDYFCVSKRYHRDNIRIITASNTTHGKATKKIKRSPDVMAARASHA
jgi:hypothetical protein